jgi:L-amino acid N-acyltransferase YncA
MSKIEIIQVHPGTGSFQHFEAVLEQVYPEGIRQKNQFQRISTRYLHACYVAMKDNTPVGRLSIYNNPNLFFAAQPALCFGTYECIAHQQVSAMLLNKVDEVAATLNKKVVLGPMSGSTWNHYRFSLRNDQPNFFMEPYNHAYYNQQLRQQGYEQVARYTSLEDEEAIVSLRQRSDRKAYFSKKGVSLRHIDMRNFESEIMQIGSFCIQAFAQNLLYTPITPDDFAEQYIPFKEHFRPQLILLAENEQHEIVGLLFAMPDYNDKTERTIIVKSIAGRGDYRYRGIGTHLANALYDEAREMGFTRDIHAFMYNENISLNVSKRFGGKPYKEYALYQKVVA